MGDLEERIDAFLDGRLPSLNDIASYQAQLAERDAEIAGLRATLAQLSETNAELSSQKYMMELAAIEKRDAEIESLKAELAGVIEGHKAQVETALNAQAYAENMILRLRQKMDAQKSACDEAIAERDASIARMEKQLSGNGKVSCG